MVAPGFDIILISSPELVTAWYTVNSLLSGLLVGGWVSAARTELSFVLERVNLTGVILFSLTGGGWSTLMCVVR